MRTVSIAILVIIAMVVIVVIFGIAGPIFLCALLWTLILDSLIHFGFIKKSDERQFLIGQITKHKGEYFTWAFFDSLHDLAKMARGKREQTSA